MEERREFPRHRVHQKAKVSFNKGEPALDCTVFDLTNEGAGLELALNLHAPKWFKLSFDNFRSNRYCYLAWQKGDKLGVAFVLRA